MDVRAYLRERLPQVEAALDAALPAVETAPTGLHAAMRQLLFPGGKRLRPAFAIAAAEAVGAGGAAALPMAVAVELIHTYSLVHDDLPCMDDDDERRGRPTVHIAFGEAIAVLAGDALQAAAFAALAGAGVDSPEVAERRLAALADLAQAAGSLELVGGQADDLDFDRAETDLARIESVHARKSAALIVAAIVGGARLGGADPATLGRLRRFGLGVGVAFQIADDVLDADDGDACSMLRAAGLEASRARAQTLLEGALDLIAPLGDPAEPLRALARFAVWRSE